MTSSMLARAVGMSAQSASAAIARLALPANLIRVLVPRSCRVFRAPLESVLTRSATLPIVAAFPGLDPAVEADQDRSRAARAVAIVDDEGRGQEPFPVEPDAGIGQQVIGRRITVAEHRQ